MQEEFEMSMMEELTFFLGLQIKQEDDEILINQTKYIREVIKKFGTSPRSIGRPMSITCKLDNNKRGKHIDQKLYREMIGSLLYLPLVYQISYLEFACVLGFNLALEKIIT